LLTFLPRLASNHDPLALDQANVKHTVLLTLTTMFYKSLKIVPPNRKVKQVLSGVGTSGRGRI
jgi:hypothetical protein